MCSKAARNSARGNGVAPISRCRASCSSMNASTLAAVCFLVDVQTRVERALHAPPVRAAGTGQLASVVDPRRQIERLQLVGQREVRREVALVVLQVRPERVGDGGREVAAQLRSVRRERLQQRGAHVGSGCVVRDRDAAQRAGLRIRAQDRAQRPREAVGRQDSDQLAAAAAAEPRGLVTTDVGEDRAPVDRVLGEGRRAATQEGCHLPLRCVCGEGLDDEARGHPAQSLPRTLLIAFSNP